MTGRKCGKTDSSKWLLLLDHQQWRKPSLIRAHLGFRTNFIPEKGLTGVVKDECHLTLLAGKKLIQSLDTLHAGYESR